MDHSGIMWIILLATLEICLLYISSVVIGEIVSYIPKAIRFIVEKCNKVYK